MHLPAPPTSNPTANRVTPHHPARRFWLLLVAVGMIAPSVARAHETKIPVAVDTFEVRTRIANQFLVEITDQDPILVQHDPRVSATGLLVYGVGANGGGSGLIELDPAFWTPDVVDGYIYDDPAGTQGGITYVEYRDRSLYIEGGGANWTWEPAGPQDEVWFHFVIDDEFLCARFSLDNATLIGNATDDQRYYDAAAPPQCPAQVCGNGVREAPEVCDDGNLASGDGCSAACDSLECTVPDFTTTYDGIQQIVFSSAVYGCDNQLCHSNALQPAQGGLDLTPGNSYDQLIHVQATAPFFTQVNGQFQVEFLDRVEPSESPKSMLFQVLDAKTNGNPHFVPAMPENGEAISADHLDAIDRWIRAGAPEDLVVEGTGALLGTCLPPEDPLKLDEPPPPPAGLAVQLQQSAWDLPASSEDELCMATYYDFTQTDLVPPGAQVDCNLGAINNPSGKCFSYNRRVLRQDGQSHHSIIHIYDGDTIFDPNQSVQNFGPFQLRQNELDAPTRGQPCDPTLIDPALGYNKHCSGQVVSGVACTGYGPVDFGIAAPSFAGSQEPFVDNTEPPGVYGLLPMTGVVVWNSHAFNLTHKDSTMAQYLDVYFAFEEDRLYPQRGIFDISKIFIQQVPPFETREYCKTITMPDGASIYELGSHTHRWGRQFRIWEPPNTPCWPGAPEGASAAPFPCEPNCQCGPGLDEQLVYFSTEYTDPVQLILDPPMVVQGTAADRTLLFCSVYDNGSTPTSPPVKRQSTSPEPPLFVQGVPVVIGGACPDADISFWDKNGYGAFFTDAEDFTVYGVKCMAGPNQGVACGQRPDPATFCETAPGLGDGECDACDVLGGFTTEDEMFILTGSWFDPADIQNAAPFFSDIAPISGLQGQTLDVAITGFNTAFAGGSTVSFGPDVVVNGTSVTTATDLVANITIAANAAPGFVDVSVDAVTKFGGFEIIGVPKVTNVAPGQAMQGETLDVVISGSSTSWSGGSAVSLGPDVTVNSTVAGSATEITANVTIADDAALGFVDVSVGGETLAGGFEILQKPSVGSVSAPAGTQGDSFDLTITGVNTAWTPSSSVSLGAGVTINAMTYVSPTEITVNLTIDPNAPPGPVNVTVDGETLVGGFQILGVPAIVSVTPAEGTQGETLDIVVIGQSTAWSSGSMPSRLFIGNGSNVVTNLPITVVSPTEIHASVTVSAGAPPGFVNVSVFSAPFPGGPSQTLVNGFEIVSLPTITSLSPFSAKQGTTSLDVTAQGLETHWDATSVIDFGNPGITVNSFNVLSPTQATANISVAPTAPNGFSLVTITTGAEVAVRSPGFAVLRQSIVSIAPTSGTQGEGFTMGIVGSGTVWVDGVTTVSFGPGVVAHTTTVIDQLTLEVGVTIDADAPPGLVDVVVTTGNEFVQLLNAFEVLARQVPTDGVIASCLDPGGQITFDFDSSGGEELQAQFTGVPGVGGTFGAGMPPLLTTISLVYPDLTQQELATAKKADKPAKVSGVALVDPGTYQLVISDGGTHGGCFEGGMEISGPLPRADAPVNETGKWKIHDCVVGLVPVTIPIVPQQSAKLTLKLKGKADATAGLGPLSPMVTLSGPNNFQMPLGTPGENLKVKNERVTLDGEYQIVIESFDGVDGCFDALLKFR